MNTKKIKKIFASLSGVILAAYSGGLFYMGSVVGNEEVAPKESRQIISMWQKQGISPKQVQSEITKLEFANQSIIRAQQNLNSGNYKICLDFVIDAKGQLSKIKTLDTRAMLAQTLLIEKELGKELKIQKMNR